MGHAYAEAFADGKTTSVGGLKSALLKVKGFDYVPENLRSDTFIKAAEAIFKAHEGLNNFYNEPTPVKNLTYYLNNVLPSDTRILDKLESSKPLSQWMNLVDEYGLATLEIKNTGVSRLIKASSEKNESRTRSARKKLFDEYYGKSA